MLELFFPHLNNFFLSLSPFISFLWMYFPPWNPFLSWNHFISFLVLPFQIFHEVLQFFWTFHSVPRPVHSLSGNSYSFWNQYNPMWNSFVPFLDSFQSLLELLFSYFGTLSFLSRSFHSSCDTFIPWHWAWIFKLLRSPRIDSSEPIPPAYIAGWTGTTTLFLLGS